jgi:hypothetical protein
MLPARHRSTVPSSDQADAVATAPSDAETTARRSIPAYVLRALKTPVEDRELETETETETEPTPSSAREEPSVPPESGIRCRLDPALAAELLPTPEMLDEWFDAACAPEPSPLLIVAERPSMPPSVPPSALLAASSAPRRTGIGRLVLALSVVMVLIAVAGLGWSAH